MLQGCLGTIVGTTADVAIEVVKIPFKVGGAVVDVVTGDGSNKEKKNTERSGDQDWWGLVTATMFTDLSKVVS